MLFDTFNEHEVNDRFLKAISEDGIRTHRLVRIALNDNIFLVEVVSDDFINRFLFGEVTEVLNFIGNEIYEDARIYLLPPRYKNDGEYLISGISSISSAEDQEGQLAWIFECNDGRKYIDSCIASNIDDLINLKTLYYKEPENMAQEQQG